MTTTELTLSESRTLVTRLGESLGAPAPIETHISWVLLCGEYAYKIKKPVALGFVDFSTLERRRRFCEAELELNRRFAPALYLGVLPVTGGVDAPCLDGAGPVLDYALKMRRFSQDSLLAHMIEEGRLTAEHVDALAQTVAALHVAAPVCTADSGFGSVPQQFAPFDECLETIDVQIARLPMQEAERRAIDRIGAWLDADRPQMAAWIESRRQRGFVRDCHGDLHLGNVVLLEGRVTAFDGLEFDEALRRIDVFCDLAFAVMDLERHGRRDLAWRLLDRYLEKTGDFDGLRGLHWYVIYRALVRAKVALLREVPLIDDAARYLGLALEHTRAASRFLAICSGLSGSGKTRIAQVLLEQCGAVRVRSDVERKRLSGLAPLDRSASALNAALYGADVTARTYERLALCARLVLDAGFPVIVDATFLRFEDRRRFRRLAAQCAVPFHLVEVGADESVLRRRVSARQAAGTDASEADLAVLDTQIRSRQPVRDDERDGLIRIDNAIDGDEAWLRALCAPAIRALSTTPPPLRGRSPGVALDPPPE